MNIIYGILGITLSVCLVALTACKCVQLIADAGQKVKQYEQGD